MRGCGCHRPRLPTHGLSVVLASRPLFDLPARPLKGRYAEPVAESQLTGSLLVAMPQLRDPNFVRTVMMIVQHDETGTFGLVLNRPVDMSAGDLCVALEMSWGGDPGLPLLWGGPVQLQTGWMLFADDLREKSADDEVTALGDGLYFAGSMNVLRTIAEQPPGDLRLFLGYAGWGPGQLEAEMAEGVWLTVPGSREAIFSLDHESMWDAVVRSLGIEPATLIQTPGVH